MAYPDNYEDCTELAQISTMEVVDYDRIQGMIDTLGSANNQLINTATESLRKYTTDTNHKVSSLLKRWQKRGW